MKIRPFRAIRYDLEKVGDLSKVVAPPYDQIDPTTQSLLYAFLGTTYGLFLVTRIAGVIRSPNLALVLPWWMWAGSYVFMLVLCVLASTLALIRVRNIEPGMVFR